MQETWVGILLGLTLAGCTTRIPEVATCGDVKSFLYTELEKYQNAVDEASRRYQETQWKVETADASASLEELAILFNDLQKTTYRRSVLERTRAMEKAAFKLSPGDCPYAPRLTRARALLEAAILTDSEVVKLERSNQGRQDALVNRSNAFRLEIPGESEPLSRSLYSKKLASLEERAGREALYKKFNGQGASKWIEWGFKDLIRSRNNEASRAGFANYYEYRFRRQLLDFRGYRQMVSELKSQLAPQIQAELKAMGAREEIKLVEPWDIRFLREKSSAGDINHLLEGLPVKDVMEVARFFYSSLGYSVDEYGFTMDLYPRSGKNTHAFAMSVVLPRVDDSGKLLQTPRSDIRFLANLKTPVHWQDIETIIHELAHAIHAAEVRQPVALFRSTGSVETEAIAMVTERMAGSTEFLQTALPRFTGRTSDELVPLLKKQERARRVEQAFALLRQVFFSDFEYELYQNPDADFRDTWARMHRDYWGVDTGLNEADWDVEHFLMAPVYVQNYAIGLLMVEQIYASLVKEFRTTFDSHKLGDKIRQLYFKSGQEFDYLDLTLKLSGEPLGTTAALKLLE